MMMKVTVLVKKMMKRKMRKTMKMTKRNRQEKYQYHLKHHLLSTCIKLMKKRGESKIVEMLKYYPYYHRNQCLEH